MMNWKTLSIALSTALALGAALAGCAEQEVGAAPQIVEKTFTLRPETVPLKVSFLHGELTGLKVVERVNEATKDVVEQPKLRGTLKLKNTATDQAVRLISGRIAYADVNGKPIALAENRSNTGFQFYAYQSERLDPGMETSRDIDLPFPVTALAPKKLGDLRLELTYIATPYREESFAVSVSIAPDH